MSANSTPNQSRIAIIDALRGFALLGLFLVHSLNHFDLGVTKSSPQWLQMIDDKVYFLIGILFHGKAYAIFSFMFGLSFYMVMDRQAAKGVDFRKRFTWRLIILLIIGYLHSLFYIGDILTIYASIGIGLIFMYKLNKMILLGLSIVFLLQTPLLIELFLLIFIQGDYLPISESVNSNKQLHLIYTDDTLFNVLHFNSLSGLIAKWIFFIKEGRIYQIVGLFIWGILFGKHQFFVDYEKKNAFTKKAFFFSLPIFFTLFMINRNLKNLDLRYDILLISENIVTTYANLAFTVILVSSFILLFQWKKSNSILNKFIPLGKMSLTTYISQSLVGVIISYGFGLAMYRYWGPTYCLIYGLISFILQQQIAQWWLNRFHHGPLEWFWRCATYTNFRMPFRKKIL